MTDITKSQDSSFAIDQLGASVRRQVEQRIRQAIVEGYFRPGDHLSDRALTAKLNVSRPLVREAVRQLEAEGLVEVIPHKGAFVKKLSLEEISDIYDVRGVLEALAARLFARNAGEEQIARLCRSFDKIKKNAESMGTGSVLELKQEFYSILSEGAHNDYVRTMLNQILNRITQLRATTLSDPDRLPRTVEELQVLIDAIVARDETAAWEASLHHVKMAARQALNIIAQGQSFGQ